ncbi:VOC family protein [Enterococcus pingfangensis]|uniref:hypothetical protein n=1 Tax=Enterococcus pingfangensis TaxID=2559924 RepID=UPI001BB1ECD4|nr:hypothetical protein [Enterococcus pingfangensis]
MTFKISATLPTVPAKDFAATVQFFKNLGFVNQYKDQERSGGYAVMQYHELVFHLFAYKKLEIPTPTNIVLVIVENVDDLYATLQKNFQESTGKKLSRSGLPKMSLPRDLNSDRRFTLTDPNGNYFIFAQSHEKKIAAEMTRLEKLYKESNTLAYSHESPREAIQMMTRALAKSDLAKESDWVIFQAYVLLADMYALAEDEPQFRDYLQQATKQLEKLPAVDQTSDSYQYYQKLLNKKES